MSPLSNFNFRRDEPLRHADSTGGGTTSEIHCRPVRREEVDRALRLLLASSSRLASDDQVLDFLSMSLHRGIDVNDIWVALYSGQVVWAQLPIASPGRTMLLLTPGMVPKRTPPAAISRLSATICENFHDHGVDMAQLLLDPQSSDVDHAYRACGFERVAELLYLDSPVRPSAKNFTLSPGLNVFIYSSQTHDLFAKTIIESYRQSLDCPGLNGKRQIEDIIVGHRATGVFDPNLWFAVCRGNDPAGVLLLNLAVQSDGVELTYLGLCPAARGQGIGDTLMRLAFATVAGYGGKSLSLAVDAGNAPALKLYFRHGLRRVGARLALIRDLRSLPDSAAPATVL